MCSFAYEYFETAVISSLIPILLCDWLIVPIKLVVDGGVCHIVLILLVLEKGFLCG